MVEKQTPLADTPDPFIQAEIARSTAPLNEAIEHGHIGAQGKALLGERVMKITELVQQSPHRTEVDKTKPVHKRTEYDKEKAHLIAHAIDEEMTYIAKDKRKKDISDPWSKKRERTELSARQWADAAAEIYDRDPLGAGPNQVRARKQSARSLMSSICYLSLCLKYSTCCKRLEASSLVEYGPPRFLPFSDSTW
jgi:hypothetical protein